MTENRQQPRDARWRRLGLGIGLVAAALGIATALWVSNGGGPGTGSVAGANCPADPEARAAIDMVAQGELAALLPDAEGHSFDDLELLDPNGAPTGLANLRGKVLLVNFWASWCAPCRREMPELAALQARYGSQDFEVVTINLDLGAEGAAKGRAFLAELGTENLPFFSDPSFASFDKLRQRTPALGLPTTLLIGPDGCGWGIVAGPAEWDSADGHAVVEAALRLAAR